MDELSLNPKFLQNLILRTRGLLSEDGAPTDDEVRDLSFESSRQEGGR